MDVYFINNIIPYTVKQKQKQQQAYGCPSMMNIDIEKK